MQIETTISSSRASISVQTRFKWLRRKKLLLGGFALALIGAGLAWQWSFLVALGVAPLLVSVAPCLAMCAFGLCMHRMCSSPGCATPNGTPQNSSPQQET